MDAVEFLKMKKRMCESYVGSCMGCPIRDAKHEKCMSCEKYMREYPVETVAIVEKWLAEHPIKTRQSEFLKLFPNAKLEEHREIKRLYPDVWNQFVSLENEDNVANYKYNVYGKTLHEIDEELEQG